VVRQILRAAVLIVCLAVAFRAPEINAQSPASHPPAPDAAGPRDVDGTAFGDSVSLGPEWLFHPGDDPQWASPTLDDHGWTVVSAQRELISYGFRNVRFGWYRMHIRLRPGAPAPVVVLGGVEGSYEVFANGARIGGHGRMDRNAPRSQLHPTGFPVPAQAIASGDLILAIRFAFAPVGNSGRGTSTPIGNHWRSNSVVALGSPGAYSVSAAASEARYTLSYVTVAALALLIAIVAFSLGGALRDRGEYIAAGVFLLAGAAQNASVVWQYSTDVLFAQTLLWDFLTGLANVCLIEFIRLVVRQPRRRWIAVLEAVSFVGVFSGLLGIAAPTQFLFRLGFFLYFLPPIAVNIVLLVLLARALRGGNREARFLLPAVLILWLPVNSAFVLWSLYYLHITPTVHSLPSWSLGPYQFSLDDVCGLVFLASILLFLVLRTLQIARLNAQVSAEMEAARTVQQILIPDSTEQFPGFSIESVYLPAKQVGGDFFQVLPATGGSLLLVVGDVAGKGLPAAMLVAALVGAARSLVRFTSDPAQILEELNDHLVGRAGQGFSTCLAAHVTPAGKVTLANAGHLPPYLDGREIELPGALPLGIVSGVRYETCSFELHPGNRLTFYSDGVVEAQSPSGELFGFDRGRELSTSPAVRIVEAASAFGQQDDITVVALACTGVPDSTPYCVSEVVSPAT
jgi:hypothetical protein